MPDTSEAALSHSFRALEESGCYGGRKRKGLGDGPEKSSLNGISGDAALIDFQVIAIDFVTLCFSVWRSKLA